MSEEKIVKYDIDGFDSVTDALLSILNEYPGLKGEDITFSVLSEDSGRAMFPISGALVMTEKRDVLGGVYQECTYPFMVVYRASGLAEGRKISVKEWLDNLGKWLERQSVTVDGVEHRLESYPELTGGRRFTDVSRQTPAYLDDTGDNKSEDWVIYISAHYKNKFNMNSV